MDKQDEKFLKHLKYELNRMYACDQYTSTAWTILQLSKEIEAYLNGDLLPSINELDFEEFDLEMALIEDTRALEYKFFETFDILPVSNKLTCAYNDCPYSHGNPVQEEPFTTDREVCKTCEMPYRFTYHKFTDTDLIELMVCKLLEEKNPDVYAFEETAQDVLKRYLLFWYIKNADKISENVKQVIQKIGNRERDLTELANEIQKRKESGEDII